MIKKIKKLLNGSIVLHQFYNKKLSGLLKRNKQKNIRQSLIEKFIKIHELYQPKIKNNSIITNKQTWYFSISHTLGRTFVHFAKQPIGIDCQTIVNLNNLKNNSHFLANKKSINKNSKINFMIQWTTKEAFLKCFHNIYHKNPDFKKWRIKLEKSYNTKFFSKNNIFLCKTIYCRHYIYTICCKVKTM